MSNGSGRLWILVCAVFCAAGTTTGAAAGEPEDSAPQAMSPPGESVGAPAGWCADGQAAAPPESLFPDGVVWLHTGCEAHKNCTGGCHLTCTGSSSCSNAADHVNCDGNKTYCNTCCTYGACTQESHCDPPSGVCTPDIGACVSSGCCICA